MQLANRWGYTAGDWPWICWAFDNLTLLVIDRVARSSFVPSHIGLKEPTWLGHCGVCTRKNGGVDVDAQRQANAKQTWKHRGKCWGFVAEWSFLYNLAFQGCRMFFHKGFPRSNGPMGFVENNLFLLVSPQNMGDILTNLFRRGWSHHLGPSL